MNILEQSPRVLRLIKESISKLDLDLSNITVLTETASGAFVITPVIAALAGAEKVYAVGGSSRFGSADDIREYSESWIRWAGVEKQVELHFSPPIPQYCNVNLVTNLGFVRPIGNELISRLPNDAAVSLMFEPWEFRSKDLDLDCCLDRGVPVLGTDEQDSRLRIFEYVGILAIKLLLEANIEVVHSKTLVIGAGVFGNKISEYIEACGGECLLVNPSSCDLIDNDNLREFCINADAVVVAENVFETTVVGGRSGVPVKWLNDIGAFIHICGNVDNDELKKMGIRKYPAIESPFGSMTMTTDYVGIKPVIDLHTAGLKVGEALVRGMRKFHDAIPATEYALSNSPALPIDMSRELDVKHR